MDDVLAWFEETLALRHEALRSLMEEPDFEVYEAALAAYAARCEADAVEAAVSNREEWDDDLAFWAPKLAELAPRVVLAVAHRGDDRYTLVTNNDRGKNASKGVAPSWEFHVDRIDAEWKIIGLTSRVSERSVSSGRRHDEPIRETRQLNSSQLRADHADFPGEVEVG